jgi:molybdopterin converting factor small subunit
VIKIKLRLSSWIAAKIEGEHSGWLTLEKEVKEDSTISELMVGIVMTYPGLRDTVYSPDTGLVGERINVALNDHLLTSHELLRAKLSDGDTIIFLPSSWGG